MTVHVRSLRDQLFYGFEMTALRGSHDAKNVPRGPGSILIDAGEAFGTAHHATTLGCLLAIDRLARQASFAKVLDLGCGSGILAIATAKAIPSADIIATDMDRQSIKVASDNLRLNGVAGRIALTVATGVARFRLRLRNAAAGTHDDRRADAQRVQQSATTDGSARRYVSIP